MNIVRATLIISLLVASGLIARSQSSSRSKSDALYAQLPPEEREPFRKGLERMISLRKSGRWSEMYEFLDEDRSDRMQFVKQMNALDSLVDFRPKSIAYIPPSDSWTAIGCAKFRKASGREFFAFSSIRGRHTLKGWRFSDIAIEMTKDEPMGIRACQM